MMCTHIQYTGSLNTTKQWYYYVFYIIVQNATTCFGLYRPSSICWENLNRDYIKGGLVYGWWEERDLALQYLMGWWIVGTIHGIGLLYSKHQYKMTRSSLFLLSEGR
jgi:hypothetical protein